MNTKIRGPWPGKEPKARTSIAVEDLKIASDPYVDHRSRPAGKYDTLFAKLKPGQCIVCQPGKAAIVKTALDKWLKATGKEGVARARSRYPSDNMGRVWWLVE
jgi:hypothetical protein